MTEKDSPRMRHFHLRSILSRSIKEGCDKAGWVWALGIGSLYQPKRLKGVLLLMLLLLLM